MASMARKHDDIHSPALVNVDSVADRTFGFAAASLIAGSFGVALFGILTVLAELYVKSVGTALTLSSQVGPLSGKATYAVVGWLVAWGILIVVLRGRDFSEKATYVASGILIGIGLVLTFPSVWKILGA